MQFHFRIKPDAGQGLFWGEAVWLHPASAGGKYRGRLFGITASLWGEVDERREPGARFASVSGQSPALAGHENAIASSRALFPCSPVPLLG